MGLGVSILKGVVLCGALVALIFLFQNPLPLFTPSAMLWHNASIAPIDLDQDESLGTNTIFVEENPIVFSEFVAPIEYVTSTVQIMPAVVASSSMLVIVSSTVPVEVASSFVVSNFASTPEIQTVGIGVVTPVVTKIEPALCVAASSTLSRVVRINEVAWMGTKNSFTDEWIELYNTSSSSFALAGAQLIASSTKSAFSIRFDDNDIITPNGYFLLERTNDTSVPNVVADKIYTGALNDDEEVVELFDAGCNSLDRIDFKKDFSVVSANADRRSMELKHNGAFVLYEGEADGVSGIFGSPKKENSYLKVESASSTIEVIVSSTEAVPQIDNVSSPRGIVINEILFDGEGSDKGKEFVELYNSSTNGMDLRGWSLKYVKTASTTSVVVLGESTNDATLLSSRGFFLIGLNNYDPVNFNDIAPDVRRSKALPNGDDAEIILVLYDSLGNEVNKITYSASSIQKEGQSIERDGAGEMFMRDSPSPKSSR